MPDTELWLTRITPDPSHPQARREPVDAAAMHRRVMSLFPDALGSSPRDAVGALFRVDHDRAGVFILVQSGMPPNPAKLPAGYGPIITKDMRPLLQRCEVGTTVRYRIIANATRKLGTHTRDGHPGHVIPLRGLDAEQWWRRHAEQTGLRLEDVHVTVLAPASATHAAEDPAGERDNSAAKRTPHDRTQFDGTAVVTDPTALRRSLAAGIGRAKAYGCGLLTIAPH